MKNPSEDPVGFLQEGRDHFRDQDAISRGVRKIVGSNTLKDILDVLSRVLDRSYPPLSVRVRVEEVDAESYFKTFVTYFSSCLNLPDVWIKAGIDKGTVRAFRDCLVECEKKHQESCRRISVEQEVKATMTAAKRHGTRRSCRQASV